MLTNKLAVLKDMLAAHARTHANRHATSHANPDEQCEAGLVVQRAAVVSRIFPRQVQAVKVVSSQEADGRFDKDGAALGFGDHGDEAGGDRKQL